MPITIHRGAPRRVASAFAVVYALAILLSAAAAGAGAPAKPKILTIAKGAAKRPLQSPALASGEAGHAVVWTTGSLEKGYQLYLAYVSPEGKVGRAMKVASAKRSLAPAIAATPDGYAIAWAEGPAEGGSVKALLVKHGAKPGAAKVLADDVHYPSTPQVAAGTTSAMVMWINAPDAKSRVYGRVLPLDGSKPSETLEVSEGGPPGAHWPALAWNGAFFMPSWYDDVAKNMWIRYVKPDGTGATDALSIKGGHHVRSVHVAVSGVPTVLWEHQQDDGCWEVFRAPLPADPKDIEMDFLEGVELLKTKAKYSLPAGMRDAVGAGSWRIAYLKLGDRCPTEDELMGKTKPAVELRLAPPEGTDATLLHTWKKAVPGERALAVHGDTLGVVWYEYPSVTLRVALFEL